MGKIGAEEGWRKSGGDIKWGGTLKGHIEGREGIKGVGEARTWRDRGGVRRMGVSDECIITFDVIVMWC